MDLQAQLVRLRAENKTLREERDRFRRSAAQERISATNLSSELAEARSRIDELDSELTDEKLQHQLLSGLSSKVQLRSSDLGEQTNSEEEDRDSPGVTEIISTIQSKGKGKSKILVEPEDGLSPDKKRRKLNDLTASSAVAGSSISFNIIKSTTDRDQAKPSSSTHPPSSGISIHKPIPPSIAYNVLYSLFECTGSRRILNARKVSRVFVLALEKLHPNLPTSAGKPGQILSTQTEAKVFEEFSLFISTKSGGGRFRYMGEYCSKFSGYEDFRNHELSFKTGWANEIKSNVQNAEVRARILLREQGVKIRRSSILRLISEGFNEIETKSIIKSLEANEERVAKLDLTCTGYDNEIASRIVKDREMRSKQGKDKRRSTKKKKKKT